MITIAEARRKAGGQVSLARLRRPALLALASLCALPALSQPIAFQDMTSLLEGKGAAARWQAFFVPSPAGSIETATVSFAGKTADSLPKGAGISAADGRRYTMTTSRPAFDTPDEARVNRREKRGRVLAVTPFAPPKAFSAGSILERQSLLTPPAGTGDVRTAFAKVDLSRDEIQIAMNMEPAAFDVPLPTRAPVVMIASQSTGTSQTSASAPAATALGYAPVAPQGGLGIFGRILRGEGSRSGKGFVPPIGADDHAWAATPLPATAFAPKEQLCLAEGIYFEARGESERGQAAVGQVILNRVRNPTYPKTICGVVYQNKDWRNRCQFSFACDGVKKRVTNKRAFSVAMRIAGEVTRGETWLADVGSATHYHATYVRPFWASAMKQVDKIGRHVFYRTYGGGWN